jgi:hypothetical protein
MPVTTMRLPTRGGVSITLTALKTYMSINPTMEEKSNEVERRLGAKFCRAARCESTGRIGPIRTLCHT